MAGVRLGRWSRARARCCGARHGTGGWIRRHVRDQRHGLHVAVAGSATATRAPRARRAAEPTTSATRRSPAPTARWCVTHVDAAGDSTGASASTARRSPTWSPARTPRRPRATRRRGAAEIARGDRRPGRRQDRHRRPGRDAAGGGQAGQPRHRHLRRALRRRGRASTARSAPAASSASTSATAVGAGQHDQRRSGLRAADPARRQDRRVRLQGPRPRRAGAHRPRHRGHPAARPTAIRTRPSAPRRRDDAATRA